MSAQTTVSTDTTVRHELTVRSITVDDLRTILSRGRDDFFARPTYGVFLTFFYLLIAVFTAVAGLGENLLPLLFPLISGVALIGPLAACGLYVLSRRREAGQDYSLWHVFDVFTAPSRWSIAAVAVILAVLFVAWMMTALALYGAYFGDIQPGSLRALAGNVLTTPAGWQLIISGCAIGFVYSVVVFAATVVGLPLLIDRKVSLAQAVGVSIRAVLVNWKAMAVWYLLVAGLMILGALPLFLGLAVVVPVLGHATWHLYRHVVSVQSSSDWQ